MGTKARLFTPIHAHSLDELVPADHFYRHLDRVLDLAFVRALMQDCYVAGIGRPSLDPQVFFRLQLVMFFEGIRSERQLLRHAADRLSVRWYLGFNLDEPLSDHSSLTRIRARYGVEVFRRFFDAILEQCQQAGLVWGRELYFDSTQVQANAALSSLTRGLPSKRARRCARWMPIWPPCSPTSPLRLPHLRTARRPPIPATSPSLPQLLPPTLIPATSPSLPQLLPPTLIPKNLASQRRCLGSSSRRSSVRSSLLPTPSGTTGSRNSGAQDRRVTGRSYRRVADSASASPIPMPRSCTTKGPRIWATTPTMSSMAARPA